MKTEIGKNSAENVHYFNRWSHFYNKDPISLWLLWTQRKVLRRIPSKKNDSILDIGCGTGSGLRFLMKQGMSKLVGIDLSPEMIKHARKNLPSSILLKVASVDKIPFPDNSFDIVINTEAFHHFPDPKKAIQEMTRVLKEGGMLCISDINFYLKPIHWLFTKIEPGCVHVYSPYEFKNLFNGAGLEIAIQERVNLFAIFTIGGKSHHQPKPL
jgi:ubiquinone/menaquinone biosynthesis C-methylase UbiE